MSTLVHGSTIPVALMADNNNNNNNNPDQVLQVEFDEALVVAMYAHVFKKGCAVIAALKQDPQAVDPNNIIPKPNPKPK